MATVIKEPVHNSPGIAVITSNELLYGIVGRKQKLLNRIQELRAKGRWIFGVHINGSLHGTRPKFPSCFSFILCGDANAEFFRNVSQPVLEWTAENFVPNFSDLRNDGNKEWDLVIVSRIAKAKRFSLSVDILHELLKMNPRLRVCIAATYLSSLDDELVYVKKVAEKLTALLPYEVSINAIDASLFGPFPITSRQIMATVTESRGVLITSEFEGGPRVLVEAASLEVPVYVCEDLKSNLEKHFNDMHVKRISTLPKIAAQQLSEYLNKSDDPKTSTGAFNLRQSRDRFRVELESVLRDMNHGIEGDWYLDDLNIRLPGHSRTGNIQILYDEGLFLDWCSWIDTLGGRVADRRLAEEKGRLMKTRTAAMREKILQIRCMAARLMKPYID